MKMTAQRHSAKTVTNCDLSFLRMSMSRKATLKHFAQQMTKSDSSMRSDYALLAIKDIGQWTLGYITMRGKKEPDIYLARDLIVKKMAALYPLEPDMAKLLNPSTLGVE